jgi:hypothetical protein
MGRTTMDGYRQAEPLRLPPIPRWVVFIAVMVFLVLIVLAFFGVLYLLQWSTGLYPVGGHPLNLPKP